MIVFALAALDLGAAADDGPVGQGLMSVRERRGPRVDHVFAGNQYRTQRARGEIGFACIQFGSVDEPHVGDMVGVRLFDDRRQLHQFLVVPRHHDAAGFHERQVERHPNVEVFAIAGTHAREFEAVRWGIETGVQQGTVALARTGQEVGAAFQQDALGTAEGEAAQDGTPDDAAAYHGDVEERCWWFHGRVDRGGSR